jgi:heme/copper-type cytochrome/quinol oxidase subunit 2
MELLRIQQIDYLSIIRVIVLVACFIVVIIIVLYNLLYLLKILNAKSQIGVNPHPYIHHLLQVSIGLSLLTALLIIIFFITGA